MNASRDASNSDSRPDRPAIVFFAIDVDAEFMPKTISLKAEKCKNL